MIKHTDKTRIVFSNCFISYFLHLLKGLSQIYQCQRACHRPRNAYKGEPLPKEVPEQFVLPQSGSIGKGMQLLLFYQQEQRQYPVQHLYHWHHTPSFSENYVSAFPVLRDISLSSKRQNINPLFSFLIHRSSNTSKTINLLSHP